MSQNDKLKVAIIGGGIGGLTIAAALQHLGNEQPLDVHIYEASAAITEIGAGINFWPRSWHIMKQIGVQTKLAELLPTLPKEEMQTIFNMRKADQLEGVSIDNIKMRGKLVPNNPIHFRDKLSIFFRTGGAARFHRAELLKVLHEQAMGQIHLSHRFKSFEEVGNEVILHFDNGTSTTCDILIGVDGIHSAVRKCFLDKQGLSKSPSYDPYWSGAYAYRGLIPVDELERVHPGHLSCRQLYPSTSGNSGLEIFQVSNKKMINVVAMMSDYSRESYTLDGPATVSVPQEEALATFEGWEPQVQDLLKCIKNPMRFALQAIRPLNSYSMGRVVLLGDAAHGMLPHQGAGAGSAVEDSYILASLLASPLCTKSTIPVVTKVYDAIRRPAANRVIELSSLAGRLCGINISGFEDVREGATVEIGRLRNLVSTISKNWEWSWNESAEDGKRRALEMLAFRIHRESTTPTHKPPVTIISEKYPAKPAPPNQFAFLFGITASTAFALAYFVVNPAVFVAARYFRTPQ